MKRKGSDVDPELEAFLTPRKIEERMPPALRAQVLARARATVAAGGVNPPARVAPLAQARPTPRAGGRLLRIAIAAAVALAAGAVAAVAALHGVSTRAPEVAAQRGAPAMPEAPSAKTRPSSDEPPTPEPEPAAVAEPPRPTRVAAKRDPFTAELEPLQRAQSAYTRRDFTLALALLAEHARRFPRGNLAEQREALRVRSLEASGRTDEAQRAATAFATRFPRSVLLPRIGGGSESSAR